MPGQLILKKNVKNYILKYLNFYLTSHTHTQTQIPDGLNFNVDDKTLQF